MLGSAQTIFSPFTRMLHGILKNDHMQWHPPLIDITYINLWPCYRNGPGLTFIPTQQRYRGYSNVAVWMWLGAWVSASLGLCLVDRVQTTVFAQSLSNVTCKLWMRGGIFLSPRISVRGDIVMRPFGCGWMSECVSACVRPSRFSLWAR